MCLNCARSTRCAMLSGVNEQCQRHNGGTLPSLEDVGLFEGSPGVSGERTILILVFAWLIMGLSTRQIGDRGSLAFGLAIKTIQAICALRASEAVAATGPFAVLLPVGRHISPHFGPVWPI